MSLKKIKVGVWGLGRAGWEMHCPEISAYPELFEIVAGCDINAEKKARFHARYPKAKVYTDGEKFLKDKNVELVAVAVPSLYHADYDIRALKAGKYVFAEKPIALGVTAVKKLEEASKKYPEKLFCRQNRRFEPCFNHVREIIDSGILGDVYEIRLNRHGYQFRDDWQTLKEFGGGQLNNWGPHLIDHALHLMDAPIADVWSDLKLVAARGDAEDHLKIIFRGTNGRVIDIEISGGVALPAPDYAVYGTRGTLVSEDEQDIKLKYLRPKFKWPTTAPSREWAPAVNSWGSKNKPDWIRETIMVEPANKRKMDMIYPAIYDTIRKGKPFPIKPEEAFEVIHWTDKIKKQNPQFKSAPDVF